MSVVTRDDAIYLIENGMRNWPHIPRIDADDLEDLRASLEGIVRRHRQSAIAELCEGLEGFVVSLTGSLRNRETMLTINHDELVRHIEHARALLSKHSPDAPGQHAGTRAIEPSDGDKR